MRGVGEGVGGRGRGWGVGGEGIIPISRLTIAVSSSKIERLLTGEPKKGWMSFNWENRFKFRDKKIIKITKNTKY